MFADPYALQKEEVRSGDSPLLPELTNDIENEANEDAENDAQSQGQVECKVFPFDEDIAGKLSRKRKSLETEQNEAEYDQNGPQQNQ
jgi:hypothetical protein